MDDYFINTKEQYHISYLLLLEIYVNGVWPSLLSHCFEFEKKENRQMWTLLLSVVTTRPKSTSVQII